MRLFAGGTMISAHRKSMIVETVMHKDIGLPSTLVGVYLHWAMASVTTFSIALGHRLPEERPTIQTRATSPLGSMSTSVTNGPALTMVAFDFGNTGATFRNRAGGDSPSLRPTAGRPDNRWDSLSHSL
jgi:hypothetical protein